MQVSFDDTSHRKQPQRLASFALAQYGNKLSIHWRALLLGDGMLHLIATVAEHAARRGARVFAILDQHFAIDDG